MWLVVPTYNPITKSRHWPALASICVTSVKQISTQLINCFTCLILYSVLSVDHQNGLAPKYHITKPFIEILIGVWYAVTEQ